MDNYNIIRRDKDAILTRKELKKVLNQLPWWFSLTDQKSIEKVLKEDKKSSSPSLTMLLNEARENYATIDVSQENI